MKDNIVICCQILNVSDRSREKFFKDNTGKFSFDDPMIVDFESRECWSKKLTEKLREEKLKSIPYSDSDEMACIAMIG